MEKHRVKCNNCGGIFTEIYPEGLDGNESYSDPDDPKTCNCNSQYTLLTSLWDQNPVQFPRLLSEIYAVGLNKEQYNDLCGSMDLSRDDLDKLFARAEEVWQKYEDKARKNQNMRKINIKVTVELLVRADDDANIDSIVEKWVSKLPTPCFDNADIEDVEFVDSQVLDSR